MNDVALRMIGGCLKPKIFKENEMVIEAGQPLNVMLIIIAGSMLAYKPIRVTTEGKPKLSMTNLFLSKLSDAPIEAFALTVDDLKTLVLSGHIFPMKSKGEV
ncbi:unnamed protein product [Prunus armeniaca]